MNEIADRIKWSTSKVQEWASNTEYVYFEVRRMHAEGESDKEISGYLICTAVTDEWLMSHVFEPITGVRFVDINWAEVIDNVTDRTEQDA